MRSKLARWVWGASLGVLVTSSPARADEWYGYQTIGGDVVATTLLLSSAATDNTPRKVLFVASASTYLLASPVIHAAHERGGAAIGAVGLRVFAPLTLGLLGLVVGAGSSKSGNWGAPLAGGFIGFGLGVLTAMVIDAAALARKESPTAQGVSALSVGRELYLPFGGTF
ncbi:MAG TPA: hypothetical protein PLR99_15420 [Polyangiaceae bacterium]|nr:hypothetical protein [Polyangiaceae bacterium]